MIDIHSHILPGVDDGARDLDEALRVPRLAAAMGVTIQLLTPHIDSNIYTNIPDLLLEEFASFRNIIKKEGIPIRLARLRK